MRMECAAKARGETLVWGWSEWRGSCVMMHLMAEIMFASTSQSKGSVRSQGKAETAVLHQTQTTDSQSWTSL